MDVEELQAYCISLKHVTEEMPFGDDVLVFKVCNKSFCLVFLDENLRMNIKCDPEEALEMREAFAAVTPGFHMNKKHWNTVTFDGTISDSMLKVWIQKSYKLAAAGLTKKQKIEFGF